MTEQEIANTLISSQTKDDYSRSIPPIRKVTGAIDCLEAKDNFIITSINGFTGQFIIDVVYASVPSIDANIMITLEVDGNVVHSPSVLTSDMRFEIPKLNVGLNDIKLMVYSDKITSGCTFDLSVDYSVGTISITKPILAGYYNLSYDSDYQNDVFDISQYDFLWTLNGEEITTPLISESLIRSMSTYQVNKLVASSDIYTAEYIYDFNVNELSMSIEFEPVVNNGDVYYNVNPVFSEESGEVEFVMFVDNIRAIPSDGYTIDLTKSYKIVAFLDIHDSTISSFNESDFDSYYQFREFTITEFIPKKIDGFIDVADNKLIRSNGSQVNIGTFSVLPFDGDIESEEFFSLLGRDNSQSSLKINVFENYSKNNIYNDTYNSRTVITDSDNNVIEIDNTNLSIKKQTLVDFEEQYAVTDHNDFEFKEVLFGDVSNLTTTLDGWISGEASLSRTYAAGKNLVAIQFTIYAESLGGVESDLITFNIYDTNGTLVSRCGVSKVSSSSSSFLLNDSRTVTEIYDTIEERTIIVPLETVFDIGRMTLDFIDTVDDVRIKNIIATTRT